MFLFFIYREILVSDVKEDIDSEMTRFVTYHADDPVKRARHSFPDKDGNSVALPHRIYRGRCDERVTHVGEYGAGR